MRDFDSFTMSIADGDPLKADALERGTVTRYWDTAFAWVTKLAHAHERAKNAEKKANAPRRRG